MCTSLEELRELISKTEDELDDLESTTKRLVSVNHRSVKQTYSHGLEFCIEDNRLIHFLHFNFCDLIKFSFARLNYRVDGIIGGKQ